jgi:surface polysaccharide O-acyltransferase-like enzyme
LFNHWLRGDSLNPLVISRRFIFDQPYEHLFFIVILLSLSIITPFIAELFSKLSQKNLLTILLATFFITWWWRPWRFILPLSVPYLSFYLAGWYLKKYQPFENLTKIKLATLFLCCWVTTAVGTWLLVSHTLPNTNGLYFYTFTNPIAIITSLGVFTFFQKYIHQPPPVNTQKIITVLSEVSLGVYLLHPMILALLTWWGSEHIATQPQVLVIPIMSVLTAGISWGICLMLQQIPILKRLVV